MVRRSPPPWRADKISGGYVVRGAHGQAIAYMYSWATEARQAKVLTADAARRIAINIARLPELPGKRIEGQRAMVGPVARADAHPRVNKIKDLVD
jgi:hypothetical protein